MEWGQVFVGILPLIGVVIGGIITYLTQNKIENKKIEIESWKEKEARNIERLKIYSEILRIDGENLMYTYVSGGYVCFDLKTFRDKFRVVCFSKLYLLDQDVVDIIRKIDKLSIEKELRKEVCGNVLTHEEDQELFNLFIQLIGKVESELKKYGNNLKSSYYSQY